MTRGPAAIVRLEGTSMHVTLNTNRIQAFETVETDGSIRLMAASA